MSLTREGEPSAEMITGMSLIMPDGRVVPIAEDGSYNIGEDDQEAVFVHWSEKAFSGHNLGILGQMVIIIVRIS